MGRLRAAALRRFGSAVLVQSARHEAALAMLCRGGVRGIACAVERRAAVQARCDCLSGQAYSYVEQHTGFVIISRETYMASCICACYSTAR